MNVILIEADQLSAKWLGCYGDPAASTPSLDALAAAGTRFANAVVNHPVCMLVDLRREPEETTNLYGSAATAGLEAELKGLRLDLLARQNDPLPNRNRHPLAQH